MSRLRRARRIVEVTFLFGFRAAPLWMTLEVTFLLATAVCASLLPLGYNVFTEAFLHHRTGELVLGSVFIAGLGALGYVSGFFHTTVGNALSQRMELYTTDRIARLTDGTETIGHFENPEYLRELELLTRNRNVLSNGPRQCIVVLNTVVRIVLACVLLATVDPLLAVLPLFGLAPFLAEHWSVRIRERRDEHLADQRRLADRLFGLATSAGAAGELRVFGLAKELQHRHRRLGDLIVSETRAGVVSSGLIAIAGWIVFAAGFVAGIAVVLVRAVHGEATAGQVVMATALAQQVRLQLSQFADAIGQSFTTVRTAGRFLWLEDHALADTRAHADPLAVPDRLARGISLDHLTFRYSESHPLALEDVTVHLPAGSTVAIVGENGAGKTTLVKLLARMYRPTAGRILIEDSDLARLDALEWRRHITAAFQDFVSFELLAGQTVGIGDLDWLDDESAVRRAVERADAGDVISALDRGLATPLGRSFIDGRELSGGQWQKLALGRAMMRHHTLLAILDEPTASLDALTEQRLFERYAIAAKEAARRHGAITILVSHRFSTVRIADLIIVLELGRVVEVGTHAALMAKHGRYAELFHLQANAYR